MSDKNKCASNCEHLKGVKCEVKNCAYHQGECYCTANQVTVGPRHAYTSADTICSTFRQKEEN